MTTPTPAAHYSGMTIDLLQERVAKLEAEKAQLVDALEACVDTWPHRSEDYFRAEHEGAIDAARVALAAVQSREAA